VKKNIVVCCDKMLRDLRAGGLLLDGKLAVTPADPRMEGDFRFCPRCGAKLPLEYEEDKDAS